MKVLLFLSYCNILVVYSDVKYIVDILSFSAIVTDSFHTMYLAFLIINNKIMAVHPSGYIRV